MAHVLQLMMRTFVLSPYNNKKNDNDNDNDNDDDTAAASAINDGPRRRCRRDNTSKKIRN